MVNRGALLPAIGIFIVIAASPREFTVRVHTLPLPTCEPGQSRIEGCPVFVPLSRSALVEQNLKGGNTRLVIYLGQYTVYQKVH